MFYVHSRIHIVQAASLPLRCVLWSLRCVFGTFHWPSAPWVVESIKDCALYVVRSVTLFPLSPPANRLPLRYATWLLRNPWHPLLLRSHFVPLRSTPFPLSWLLVYVPNAPPHLTLIRNQSMKDFVNWLYSQLVIAAFAFVLLVVPQLIERLIWNRLKYTSSIR